MSHRRRNCMVCGHWLLVHEHEVCDRCLEARKKTKSAGT